VDLHNSYRLALPPIALWIENRRKESWTPGLPWPDAIQAAFPPTAPTFAKTIHLGATEQLGKSGQVMRLANDLVEMELASISGSELLPGRWQATAAAGIFSVRDRSERGEPEVYLGEDGLRLLDSVMAYRPAGYVLDVGCGSGLATAGLALYADRVVGFDSVPRCVDATLKSATLNGVEKKVETAVDDLTNSNINGEFDCIIANLPGVPLPPKLPYHVAGNGGSDGLRLSNALFELASRVVRRDVSAVAGNTSPAAIMRLQSIGDARGPYLLRDLDNFSHALGMRFLVTSDSRMDYRVRNGLTSKCVLRAQPRLDPATVHQIVTAHAVSLGVTDYYSSSVIGRFGRPEVLWRCEALPNRLDNQSSADLRSLLPSPTIAAAYLRRLSRLPLNYWEIGTIEHITGVAEQMTALFGRLSTGLTVAEAAFDVFSEEFARNPIDATALYEAANLLVDTALSLRNR
jgi:SAM-dependent methyltransferase